MRFRVLEDFRVMLDLCMVEKVEFMCGFVVDFCVGFFAATKDGNRDFSIHF